MQREDKRQPDQIRNVTITKDFQSHPAGSVLIAMGRTRVICAASIFNGIPRWMRAQNVPGGWLTAEYSMLPSATGDRKSREATQGKQQSRTVEIQRLIGRSLRAALDLTQLGAFTIYMDCDVIEADGGTRCASITGASVALQLAVGRLFAEGRLKQMPEIKLISAISVGMVKGTPVLDLDYSEDFAADVDMNVVMNSDGHYIELQGTAEEQAFDRAQTNAMLDLADSGCAQLLDIQRQALRQTP